ncbi:dihydroneopterin aldolase [Naumannella huperziae]
MTGFVADPALTDRIELRGITGFGRHGVHPHERRDGQRFVADVTCWLDFSPAAASDDLADTIDYAGLAQAVVADIEGEPLDLLEALGARIAASCLADSRVRRVSVTVHKPDVDMPVPVTDVAVTIQRSADR